MTQKFKPDTDVTVEKERVFALTDTPSYDEMLGGSHDLLQWLRASWDHSANTKGEKTVGHLASEVIPEYRRHLERTSESPNWEGFMGFYLETFDGAKRIDQAAGELYERVTGTMEQLGVTQADPDHLAEVCEQYVIKQLQQGFTGILVEETVIKSLAAKVGAIDFEVETSKEEEAAGIDGRIAGEPVQIKHRSYGLGEYDKLNQDGIILVLWERNEDGSISYEFQSSDF